MENTAASLPRERSVTEQSGSPAPQGLFYHQYLIEGRGGDGTEGFTLAAEQELEKGLKIPIFRKIQRGAAEHLWLRSSFIPAAHFQKHAIYFGIPDVKFILWGSKWKDFYGFQ